MSRRVVVALAGAALLPVSIGFAAAAKATAAKAAATADTVSQQGIAEGHRYRGGVPALGGVGYHVALDVARDPARDVLDVRASASIVKDDLVLRVQVDRVALGTSTAATRVNRAPANSGAAASVASRTDWAGVAPGSCTQYRVRADFSVRWADGAVSRFSALSPLSTVCGPTSPPVYADCAALNQDFPHGVGRPGAVDHTTGSPPVTTFYVSGYVYAANPDRDRDKDGIACERL